METSKAIAKIEKTAHINAPVKKVFDYMAEPSNQLEYWPSVIEISNVERLPNGGYSADWVYKMAGFKLKGSSETLEFIPNERIVEKTKGGIESTFTWMFEKEGEWTKLTCKVDYKIPIPVIGKLAEAVIIKLNENEADVIIANLKARMEG